MAPADQRFVAASALGADIDDRLVVHLEFAARQRVAHGALEIPLGLEIIVHARIVEAEGVTPVGLGAIERDVGIFQHAVRVLAVLAGDADADTGGQRQLAAADVIGPRDGPHELGRHGGRALAGGQHGVDDGELIAAEPRHGIAVMGAAADALGQ